MAKLFNYNHDCDASATNESAGSFFTKAAVAAGMAAVTACGSEVGRRLGSDLYKVGVDWIRNDKNKKDDK